MLTIAIVTRTYKDGLEILLHATKIDFTSNKFDAEKRWASNLQVISFVAGVKE